MRKKRPHLIVHDSVRVINLACSELLPTTTSCSSCKSDCSTNSRSWPKNIIPSSPTPVPPFMVMRSVVKCSPVAVPTWVAMDGMNTCTTGMMWQHNKLEIRQIRTPFRGLSRSTQDEQGQQEDGN